MDVNPVELMFLSLKAISPTSLPKVLAYPFEAFSPRKSKALTTNLIKDVNSATEPRILVLVGHLYFDYLLGKIAEKSSIELDNKQRKYLYEKIQLLAAHGKLDNQTHHCLLAINNLRNRLVHDIFFDIAMWDATTIPYVELYGLKAPRRKTLVRAFNTIVLRLSFFALLDSLLEQNRWIYLEDIRKS